MARNNKQKLDLLLKCALCNVGLVNNQPKSLPCLHTFCTPCLTKNGGQHFVQGANIVCPVCHTIASQSSKSSEITKNLELDVIIEKLLHVCHIQQSERYCGMCPKEGVASNHWCQDCGKFLCDVCLVHHGRYKPNDKVIAVSQGEDCEKVSDFNLLTKCLLHNEKFKMYCVQCKLCLCSACLLEHRSDKNAKCVPVSIEKVAPDIKTKVQHLLIETCSHSKKMKHQIERMEIKIADLKRQFKEKAEHIWGNVDETVRRLKENARALIEELEAGTESEIAEFEKLIQLRQDHVKEMEIIDNNFHQLLQSFDDVDILLNYSRLESKCKNLFMKPDNNNNSHVVNIQYNMWYLKTHEMSKDLPLGYCRKDLEQTEAASASYSEKNLNTKQSSNMTLQFVLPPVPTLRRYTTGFTSNREFSCIFVTEEDHVLMGMGAYGELREYNKDNKLCGTYKLTEMKYCDDMCSWSDKIYIVDGNLILMQMNKTEPFLTLFNRIEPHTKYYSICNCFGKLLVCDYFCRVHLLSEEGIFRRTILDIKGHPSAHHKIRCGPFRDTFLLLQDTGKLHCYRLDGKCLFLLDLGDVRDVITDRYGYIYVLVRHNKGRQIYVLSPDTSEKHYLYTDIEDSHFFAIFIKNDIFYISFEREVEKRDLSYVER